MNYQRIFSLIIPFFLTNLSIFNVGVHGGVPTFSVTSYGAVADGRTDSKAAFAYAWKKACETREGMVLVPADHIFMLSAGDFRGPCNGQTRFKIDGGIIASDDPNLDRTESWISFNNIEGLSVFGKGVLNGKGAGSWARCGNSGSCPNRPTTLRIHDVKVATIFGITLQDSKMFHMVLHKCQNVKVSGIHIRAPEHSRNTDGIHVGQSNDVDILDTDISTGDDCVSLGDGSTNIKVIGVTCGPGHGISIGSLGNYEKEEDVRGIRVRYCHFYNTDNGLRIKTWAPSRSSLVISDVTYQDITMQNVKNPIIIDQHYCPHGRCARNGESSVKIQGVRYINVKGSSATQKGVDIQCSKTHPCKDITFTKLDLSLNGRQPAQASCSNVDALFQGSNPSRCGYNQ